VRYRGIGVATRSIDGRTFVADVLEGTPAARAGLLTGDEILAAAGGAFHPILSFRGQAGAPVVLEVQRISDPASRRRIEVVPEEIEPDALFLASLRASARVFEREGRRIAYVHVRSYAGESYHEALVELVTGDGPLASAEALVLDLRGGWGGASPAYLNLFNRRLPRLATVARDGSRADFDPQWRKPVVLLVDGTTRSGKEVMAYGFRRYGIGPVVGETTAGAVLAGRPYLLADGSLLFLAVGDVLVDGERLEGRGVEPDVRVERRLPYAQGADPPLEKALELAAEQ
jgi:carboxyl-terminal processing protease